MIPAGEDVIVPTPDPVTETTTCAVSKSAVTFVVPIAGCRVQDPVPAHAPVQPVNTESALAAAVRTTVEPGKKPTWQKDGGQSIPAGSDVTVPEPGPVSMTLMSPVSKSAVTVVVPAAGLNEQVLVPGHVTPLQPLKTVFAPGVAVRMTVEPGLAMTVQVPAPDGAKQVMPAGDEVTVPEPAPTKAAWTTAVSKFAVTVVVPAAGANEQDPVPGQVTPVQPVNIEFESGVAVNVTVLAGTNSAEQVPEMPPPPRPPALAQAMPEGDEATLPPP